MNWLQKNTYIVVLFVAFLVMGAFLLITDNGKTTYEQIEIQHGDTLWTLAEQYRGKMTTQEWIEQVKAENALSGEHIVAGHAITVPVNSNSIYIANLKSEEEFHSVEVAVKNQ
ncbi:cell division suppressor protein YneA [Ureibacillus aquaedulcis]|uniref:LysM peptidoglycan-binding domain-containing protein n=1 Tax=Ureibacillus aquaedulcis TaxID=3058421 RepID=A0ABT8GVT9_9BACL|nr:LysM peptidoglycan-binding domain-containing protein [Ureibacillus sp. BA0131]MDN4495522.1 LysM peptidoglycan-binding domain-containing protein [Ureibacillus sp. BA0131]